MNKLVAVVVAGAALLVTTVASADPHTMTLRSPAMRTATPHTTLHTATWNAGFRGMSPPARPIVFHMRNIRGGTSTLKVGAVSSTGGGAAGGASGAKADAR